MEDEYKIKEGQEEIQNISSRIPFMFHIFVLNYILEIFVFQEIGSSTKTDGSSFKIHGRMFQCQICITSCSKKQ